MMRDLVLLLLGGLLGIAGNVLVVVYNDPIAKWSEGRRITRRLKKQEREKATYALVVRLRTDETVRTSYFAYLNARLTFYLMTGLTMQVLLVLIHLVPKSDLPLSSVFPAVILFLFYLTLSFITFIMATTTFSQVVSLRARLFGFDEYRDELRN